MFLVPPPPAPPTPDERLAIGRMLAHSAWTALPQAFRSHARFDVRVVADGLRLLLDHDAFQAVTRIPGASCLDRAHIGTAVLDLVRL